MSTNNVSLIAMKVWFESLEMKVLINQTDGKFDVFISLCWQYLFEPWQSFERCCPMIDSCLQLGQGFQEDFK